MAVKRALQLAVLTGICIAALAYLRDPPWLLSYTHGLGPWEVDGQGTRFRWTGGRASFHVPADVGRVALPMRSLRESPADWPITATITVDDRPVERVSFDDDSWHLLTIRLPPRGSRCCRRIDIKLDRLRSGGRGIQLGELRFR